MSVGRFIDNSIMESVGKDEANPQLESPSEKGEMSGERLLTVVLVDQVMCGGSGRAGRALAAKSLVEIISHLKHA